MKGLTLFVACLALAGCGAKSGEQVADTPKVSTSESGMPEGWKAFSVTGFKIALPDEWQVLDMTKGDFEKVMDSVSWPAGSEQLKEQAKQMAASGMVKLFAFAPTKGSFATNLNVNAIPINITDLEEVKKQGIAELSKIAKNVNGSVLKNPDRVVVNSSITMNGPKGPITYETHAQQFIHNGQLYTFTFSCSPESRKSVEDVAARAVPTIKFD